MYCTNCGSELPDNATSCPACGKVFNTQSLDNIGRYSFDEDSDSSQVTAAMYQKQISQANRLQANDILNAAAIVSLATGVVSLISAPIILGFIAIIAGNRALKKNPKNPLAKAGQVLGIISLVIGIISLITVAGIGGTVLNYFLYS